MLRAKSSKGVECQVIPHQACPAKTFADKAGNISPGRAVLNHCEIVGNVASEIIDRFPGQLKERLFPVNSALVAAAHDIGKVSPCFYEKIRQACTPGLNAMVALSAVNPKLESNWGGHAGVSQVTARDLNAPPFVAEIVGQHHGYSPPVAGCHSKDECFGGPAWQAERQSLVVALQQALNMRWPVIEGVPQARLLAGLTSVADWIGSGDFFEDPQVEWKNQIRFAVDAAGLIPPIYRNGLSFSEIFGFGPFVAQQTLIDRVWGPGVYVLEAPMGHGKTEAALYAAYQMLQRNEASGVYFALPTQLTSNKIQERFNGFLKLILAPECSHQSWLLHGKAWLLETAMGEEGQPGRSWFNHAKRGLLAPFAVGTLDQALMATMNVKHGFVRAFGLAGKVVILDEIHTYDAYTGTLLDALVELLRELHCTVIILSATLNKSRRRTLIGRPVDNQSYPLITSLPLQGELTEIAIETESLRTVDLHITHNEKASIDEAIERASHGQQVLWIENTVSDAQERYLDLAARAQESGTACGLLHSRYTLDDRSHIEDRWVNLFGKPGWKQRLHQGRILVGTQVLEQSLDIDADFLVSRFAPTDMLLQRLGRLWRHDGTPRHFSTNCEAWILAPELPEAIQQPTVAFGKSAFVYSPYVLCRSLEIWRDLSSVCLPQDIRQLIEQTYCEREEQGLMARWLYDLDHGAPRRTGRNAMRQLARVGLAEGGKTLPEAKAQTRYSDIETTEVLLIRNVRLVVEQRQSQVTLLSGDVFKIPWDRHKLDKEGWRRLSANLMRQVLTVNVVDAPLATPIDTLKRFAFHHCFYLGSPEHDEALLRVARVDELGELHGIHNTKAHDKYALNYRSALGYRCIQS
jgi:CRISPR-associated endonuclease/helicase Cas3